MCMTNLRQVCPPPPPPSIFRPLFISALFHPLLCCVCFCAVGVSSATTTIIIIYSLYKRENQYVICIESYPRGRKRRRPKQKIVYIITVSWEGVKSWELRVWIELWKPVPWPPTSLSPFPFLSLWHSFRFVISFHRVRLLSVLSLGSSVELSLLFTQFFPPSCHFCSLYSLGFCTDLINVTRTDWCTNCAWRPLSDDSPALVRIFCAYGFSSVSLPLFFFSLFSFLPLTN